MRIAKPVDSADLQIGGRFPAHIVGSGGVILAHLSEAELNAICIRLRVACKTSPIPKSFKEYGDQAERDRAHGYALGRSVVGPAVSACAAAVLDKTCKPVASLSVVEPHSFVEEAGGQAKLSGIVMDVARDFSAQVRSTIGSSSAATAGSGGGKRAQKSDL